MPIAPCCIETARPNRSSRQRRGRRKTRPASVKPTAKSRSVPAERDADGRRIWEKSPGKKRPVAGRGRPRSLRASASIQSKDATGESGSRSC